MMWYRHVLQAEKQFDIFHSITEMKERVNVKIRGLQMGGEEWRKFYRRDLSGNVNGR
jgi:hypothetical protein